MEYEDLEEYSGENLTCTNCGREFTEGEIISVDINGRTFCYSDSEGGCAIAFCFASGEIIYCNPARFRGSKWHKPESPTPNYPNMPINDKRVKDDAWLRKMINSLNV